MDAATDILGSRQRVPNTQFFGRARHQLHQALGTDRGQGFFIECRLGMDHSADKSRINSVFLGRGLNF